MINYSQYKKTYHLFAISLCLILMAYAAQWAWQFLAPNNTDVPEPTLTNIKPATPKTRIKKPVNHDMRDILSANIFKQNIKAVVTPIQTIQTKIPQSKQALFLKGLINSNIKNESIALIASQKHASPLPYQIGDKLPNNSGQLYLVLMDSVQIKRNGRLEKLMLIEAKDTKPLTKNAFKRSHSEKPTSLQAIKSSYKQNSSQLLKKFGLKKTTKGIKLSTRKGRLPPGLQANDVITSINGYSLNDLENNPDLIDDFLNSGNIEASLERNGRNIHFRVPQKLLNQWKKSQ